MCRFRRRSPFHALTRPRHVLLAGFLASFVAGVVPDAAAAGGVPSCGVYVSTTGSDDAGCGASPTDPCRTIQNGITRAVATGQTCVLVQAGSYNGPLTLANGVHVEGGYDAEWQLGSFTDPAHQVVVNGGLDPIANTYLTIRAISLATATRLSALTLVGADATGTVSNRGRSTQVILADAANLVLRNLRLEAGNAAAGGAGNNGMSASASAAPNGTGGGGASEYNSICETSDRGAGGGGGFNSCASGVSSNGGSGGPGGTMDTSCNDFFGTCEICTATAGLSGATAAYSPGIPGNGGGGGAGASTCGPGLPGQPGQLTNGIAGAAPAANSGVLVGNVWYAASGGNGGLGENGGGGGGGGGSGGCDIDTDSYGAGGGGGGAGGCRAPTAATGGGGGGGSFGVFATRSTLVFDNVEIVRGNGGNGGSGGAGGRGQPGGVGGPGGPASGDSDHGGAGGAGAHGGHGGGAAGGAGGISAAIYVCPGTAVSGSVAASAGAGGTGGAGGISAPTAPPAQDDGFDAPAGPNGSVFHSATYAGAGCPAGSAPTGAEGPACDAAPCLVDAPVQTVSTSLEFYGAQPNPIRGAGAFRLSLPAETHVKLELLDHMGRRVATLVDETRGAGLHTIAWDGRLDSGRAASPGVYLARMEGGARVFTRTVIVLR